MRIETSGIIVSWLLRTDAVAHDGPVTSLSASVGIDGVLHDDMQLHNLWRVDEDDE